MFLINYKRNNYEITIYHGFLSLFIYISHNVYTMFSVWFVKNEDKNGFTKNPGIV
jgi:hypothetical protein